MTIESPLNEGSDAVAEIENALRLFEHEIAAIAAGDLNAIEALRPRKRDMLIRLEDGQEAIQAALASDQAGASALRDNIYKLQKLTAESERQLRRLSEAAGEVLQELQRIRDRHSLKGLYSGSGQAVAGTNHSVGPQLDKSI